MLDRTIAPPAEKIDSISIPEFKKRNLVNGVPLYFLNSGEQEVLKIDIVFAAGVKYEKVPGSSFLVAKLLTAGTQSKNAAEIAGELDYYGAFTETSSSFDKITISIYCLKKFAQPILSLLY
ncbi:MAG: insulinase family protein, partial [Cyclobacteriaceae bacterium]